MQGGENIRVGLFACRCGTERHNNEQKMQTAGITPMGEPSLRSLTTLCLSQICGEKYAPDWDRTSDLAVNSRTLCRLSYQGFCAQSVGH